MKSIRFITSLIAGLASITFMAQAQPYKTAAGLRLGYPTSITIKHFLGEQSAVEAYVGTRGYFGLRWYNLSGAYLYHSPIAIDGLENLNWYVGAGASAFFWNLNGGIYSGLGYTTTTLGVQGYLGVEYSLNEWDLPLSITLDWIPTFFVGQQNFGLNRLGAGNGTLGVRYHLR